MRVYERGTFSAKNGTYKRIRRWSSCRGFRPGIGVHLAVTITSRFRGNAQGLDCKKPKRSSFHCIKSHANTTRHRQTRLRSGPQSKFSLTSIFALILKLVIWIAFIISLKHFCCLHLSANRGVTSFSTSCKPGWLSFPHIPKIALMARTHWPHQHFEPLSFLTHPNNA